MKKLLISILACLCNICAFAQASLTISDFEINQGETKTIQLELINTEVECRAIQLTIQLPEGLSFAGKPTLVANRIGSGLDEFDEPITSEKTVGFSKSSTYANAYNMTVISTADAIPFAGHSGAVADIKVKTTADSPVGEFKIKLLEVEITDVDGETPYRPADKEISVKIIDPADAEATSAANDFKTAHATILAKTTSTVVSSDAEAINAALTAYSQLSDEAKAKLTDEKALLDALKEKVEEITTGITNVGIDNSEVRRYDLSGKLVNGNVKGVIIKNGKKILKK